MSELGIQPRNKVRFAFWGAEESGLVGSEYYVSQLSKSQQKNIAAYLNYDMVGSPNYVRFVYDGDGSEFGTVGPNGSDIVENVFNDFFASQNLPTNPTEFACEVDLAAAARRGGSWTTCAHSEPDSSSRVVPSRKHATAPGAKPDRHPAASRRR